MFSPKSVTLLLSIAVLLAACSPEPKVLKRYQHVSEREAEPGDPTPSVSFFALTVPRNNTQKTIFDLTDQGQAALLNGYARVTSTPDELRSAASAKLEIAPTQPADVDLTRFKRRIVFTVERGGARSADRLEWLKIKLAFESPKYVFTSWDKAETAYETIDLGALKINQKREAKINTSLTPASVGSLESVDVGVSGSESLDESQDQRRRIVDLNVSLPDDTYAAIVRQGAIDRDLDGNTIIDFEIQYTGATKTAAITKFSNLLEPDGKPVKANEIRMVLYEAHYPQEAEDVEATVSMEYDFRHVDDGHETLKEGDDHVVMIHGQTGNRPPRVVVSKSDQIFEVWGLYSANAHVSFEPGGKSACKTPGNNTRVEFLTRDEALDFYWWLYLSQVDSKPDEPIVITPAGLSLCLESGTKIIKSMTWADVNSVSADAYKSNDPGSTN